MGILFLGIFFLIISLLFFLCPNVISKINKWGETVLFDDQGAIKHHRKTGMFFLIISIIIFITYLTIK